jgi:hypothetical protein
VRQAAVIQRGAGVGALVWRGGANPGSITIDAGCTVTMDDDRMAVRRAGRSLHFRSALGGPGLAEWRAAILNVLGDAVAPAPAAADGRALNKHQSANAAPVSTGGRYEGARGEDGLPEGRGVEKFADGDEYEGEFRAGKREGRGVYRYADGAVYDGELRSIAQQSIAWA